MFQQIDEVTRHVRLARKRAAPALLPPHVHELGGTVSETAA